MKFIKVVILALLTINAHAITPLHEIFPPAEHRIVAMSLSDNGVCWIETVTQGRLRMDKWLDRVSPLQVKTLDYQAGEVYEDVLWQAGSAIGHTIVDYKVGDGYLSLTYTNLDLVPRTKTITVAQRNRRWMITNRSQPMPAIPSLSLPIHLDNQIILPSPSPIVKSFRLTQNQALEIAVSAKVGANQVRFALPLARLSSQAIAHLERQWQQEQFTLQASANRHILVWGDANQKVVLSMPTFDRLLIDSLENHLDELSYQQDSLNQLNAVKFFNLMTLWRDKADWPMTQQLAVDRFLATKAAQLKQTLLALPVPNTGFTLLFSAWDNLARVIPQQTQLQIEGSLLILELPNQTTVYYIKGHLPDFVPTAQQQAVIKTWLAKNFATTPRFITNLPPASTIGMTQIPDTLASLEITTLHAKDNNIISVASLDTREATIFEHFLTQGMKLEMRLNTEVLGFETKTQHTIPLALQVNPTAMETVLVDQDYTIIIDVSSHKLASLFQQDKAPKIEVNYQGRIQAIELSLENTNYTMSYKQQRDRQEAPIYRFQWRIKFADNHKTAWQPGDFPYLLITD
jgi:hypothetical protein